MVKVYNQSVVPVDLSLRLKIGVVCPLFVPKVIYFVLSTLYYKYCLLILPFFVAICEI
jgi:hypothetical protein